MGDLMLLDVRESAESDDTRPCTALAQLPQTKAIRIAADASASCFRREPPRKNITKANARVPPAAANGKRGRGGMALAMMTEGACEFRVTAAVTGFPLAAEVTVAGLMLQVMPGGREDAAGQASAMMPVKFKMGVRVIVPVPGCPAVRNTLAGELAI